MECLWSMFGHWQSCGNRDQSYTAVLHVCVDSDDGITDNYLYGAGFLEEYPEVYVCGQAQSLVLFVGFME